MTTKNRFVLDDEDFNSLTIIRKEDREDRHMDPIEDEDEDYESLEIVEEPEEGGAE